MNLHLCADDYGLTPEVSEAIVHLVENKRIQAVSCLCHDFSALQKNLKIKNYQGQIEIGIHLNLTEQSASIGSINSLIVRSHLRQLSKKNIQNLLEKQFQNFINAFNQAPSFIDGHQHIHVLPVIRDIILKLRKQYCPNAWVRSPIQKKSPNFISGLKSFVINHMGALTFKKTLNHLNIKTNQNFLGIYSFGSPITYRSYFLECLKSINQPTLMMCHPGLPSNNKDPIAAFRQQEYNYFLSNQFLEDTAGLR